MPTILDDLTWRGLLHDMTPDLADVLAEKTITLYAGFDPTANSLHVGNLVPLLGLVRFQRAGHTPIALAGGATGLIGDPSGKASERQLLDADQVAANIASITEILRKFLDFSGSNAAKVTNNYDWLSQISTIEFLRDVGKHFTINTMLGKESVRSRMEAGISYTEFSYMLLQARDYLELYDRFGCALQIGGSDQWGNIIAGTDLIRRTRGVSAFGLTLPLVTKADGTKFGKSESGAVWLTADRTSPYEFYQFWFNTDDRDVVKFLKFFTFLSEVEIGDLATAVAERPEAREAQKRLAAEMTDFIHGPTETAQAIQASRVLFGEEIGNIGPETLLAIFRETPSTDIEPERFTDGTIAVADLAVAAGLAGSKADARRTIEGGGLYFNNVRVADARERIARERFIGGRYGVLRKGAKTYHLVRITGE